MEKLNGVFADISLVVRFVIVSSSFLNPPKKASHNYTHPHSTTLQEPYIIRKFLTL